MNERLTIAFIFFGIGIILFMLGRLNILKTNISSPLFISGVIFFGLYSIKPIYKFLIPFFGFRDKTNSLLFYDGGSGLLGLLPTVLTVLFIGKYILKMNINEQWNGTVKFNEKSIKYGLIAGFLISAITLIIIFLVGQKFNFKLDFYRYGINNVTNLYEEIICRGLLLACCVKYWNKISGIIWTSIIFGLMHGLNEKAIFIVLTSWLMSWAVLKAKSLWAGWISHQTVDMIVDTLVP
jgi:membrane protease YdiL (CAAX protease family)